jgi:hypothetical protein
MLLLLLLCGALVQTAFAQKTPQPGTNITVSKSGGGMYTKIQDAVNAAWPGAVIEILDEGVYAEQVTIDGRGESPWSQSGVVGGKSGITLRYVPASGVAGRPVIRWNDTRNRSPRSYDETLIGGDLPGQAGNWQNCAALRIIYAPGVTIEGIIIDGGGSAPFLWNSVWEHSYPLAHGNAAIAVVVSGNVQIRDCELRNAFIGMYVKDRNSGGIFANTNPNDLDAAVPLSGFGATGRHLIEYNKIHSNEVGLYFESSWDLGSVVRYNLIYHNYKRLGNGEGDDLIEGGIKFKDNYLSPVAIYNNTFFENSGDLRGGWQVGYQHLVFNNIFGKPKAYRYNSPDRIITGKFPNRMKNNIFAADTIQVKRTSDCPGQIIIDMIRLKVAILGDPLTQVQCGDFTMATYLPGAVIPMSGAPEDDGNRWLETAGYTSASVTLPNLFMSTDTASPDFLVPNLSHQEVKDFIMNKGWADAGIINEDGGIADIGAIPQIGKRPGDGVMQTSRVRVSPSDAIIIHGDGDTVTASFNISQEIGSLNNPIIKYIRWVAPIPDNINTSGANGKIIPAAAIKTVGTDGARLVLGYNKVVFTIPTALTNSDRYGFFEIVVGGTDGIGRQVVSDVGFLPYRKMNSFEIQALDSNGDPILTPSVTMGQPITIRVKADGLSNTTAPIKVNYSLLSDRDGLSSGRMATGTGGGLLFENGRRIQTDTLLSSGGYTKTYNGVRFVNAGTDAIYAAGFYKDAFDDVIEFMGVLFIDVVTKSIAESNLSVNFLSPASNSLRPAGSLSPTVNGYYPVEVKISDDFGNAVRTAVDVTLSSSNPALGYVYSESTVKTDPATGIAQFIVQAGEDALSGGEFNLTASITHKGETVSDVASLRIEPRQVAGPKRPKIVAGEYMVGSGDWIYAAQLTFDDDVTDNWFHSMDFAFGPLPFRGSMTNLGCVLPVNSDPKSVIAIFGCAFHRYDISLTDVANSSITVNYNALNGWAPQTLSFSDGRVVVVSVLERDRAVPKVGVKEATAVVVPASALTAEFTAGPNPAGRLSGAINFFRNGTVVKGATLYVYGVSGNAVRKISIIDKAVVGVQSKRKVGSWDLKDKKGRPVSAGTYVVRGVVRTGDSKRERVSVVVGVR